MGIALGILLLFLLAYILLLKGRIGHSGWAELSQYSYAHRGLHSKDAPENSIEAFRRAIDHGYGAELDVHLLSDGNLAVIHDSSLKRMTGADVEIEKLTVQDLPRYRLHDTEQTIPLFSEVLDLFEGKTPLIVELKTADNVEQLTKTACEMLDRYHVCYCIESFDPRCIAWLRQNRPDVIRGQLSENFLKDKGGHAPFFLKFAMTFLLFNFRTQPDFIAYRFRDRTNISLFLCRWIWGIHGVTWTLKTKQEYDITRKDGFVPIFEDFTP